MLLIAPVTWEHYFLWLLVPLAEIWRRGTLSRPARWLFWLFLVILWNQPRWLWQVAISGDWLYGTAKPWQSLTVLSAQFYALAGLFFLALTRSSGDPQRWLSFVPDRDREVEFGRVSESDAALTRAQGVGIPR